ncbi:MAG: transposase [Anaerolineae bacterium]
MARKVRFVQGHSYHVYNRGADRGAIFRTPDNYLFLLRRVKKYAARFEISVIAYCLMTNHYHFLLRQNGPHPLSAFVQAVFNSYTKAFNKMFGRSGTLFEGPFRAIPVEQDGYLTHLCRYIHRNPVEPGLVEHPAQWPFSNYREWVGERNGTLVDGALVREWFPSPGEYELFVLSCAPSAEIEAAIREFQLE